MKHGLLVSGSALLGLCLVSAFPGCGGKSSNGNNPGDGGQMGDTSSNDGSGGGDDGSSGGDASSSSSGGSSSSSGGEIDAGCTVSVMPSGTPIVPSATASVQGVTSDNNVIFYDSAKKNLYSVPLAGGTPALVDTWDMSQAIIFTSNKVALYWNGATQKTGVPHGALGAWTAAGGAKPLGSQSNFSGIGGYVDVSADGSLVLYTDNVTNTSADIYVAGSDGSNKQKLVTGASIGMNCRPVTRFAGNTPVVSYCASPPDAGTTLNATVAAYSAATGAVSQTFAPADAFYGFSIGSVTSGGTTTYSVEYVTNAGMFVEAIGGTPPTAPIDAKGAGGIFTHTGTDVIYFETDGTMWRSPIATPAPARIATMKFAGTLALSADDNWVETFRSQAAMTGFTDMWLVSTTPADGGNTPTQLTPTNGTSGANFGDAFTADNKHALFFPDVFLMGAGYIGDYDNLALPPAGMPSTIGTNVWEEFATTGGKTLYNDNYLSNVGFAGYADIESIDLSGTTPATTLVSGADANFFLTADKKTIVYSWSSCPGSQDGIYTVAAP